MVLLPLAALLTPGAVRAACTSPLDGITATCNGSGGLAICQMDPFASIWVCDLDRDGATTAVGEAYLVLDDAGDWCTAGNYCAFGVDGTGDTFCCDQTPVGGVNQVKLLGTDFSASPGDELAFQFNDGTNFHELQNGSTTALQGMIQGRYGEDLINGSRYANPLYDEILEGNEENDILDGWEGNDEIVGSIGDDQLEGGPGGDVLQCGISSDLGWGGPGNDTGYGDAGVNFIDGGTGLDELYGSVDRDVLCGGPDAVWDQLFGNAGADDLWGATTADDEWGGAGFDECSLLGGGVCDSTITADPGCP